MWSQIYLQHRSGLQKEEAGIPHFRVRKKEGNSETSVVCPSIISLLQMVQSAKHLILLNTLCGIVHSHFGLI
jgi:hypothetical protein